jgi:hypothetical protein
VVKVSLSAAAAVRHRSPKPMQVLGAGWVGDWPYQACLLASGEGIYTLTPLQILLESIACSLAAVYPATLHPLASLRLGTEAESEN